MRKNTPLAIALIALGLMASIFGPAVAAAPQGHESHGASVMELTLNKGQKWQTDEALRTGMNRIRDALDAALPLIHTGRYKAADFSALADQVQEQVDYVVANCKLPEEADLQLHVALTRVLDGVSALKEEGGREQGVATIVQALNVYGDYFDHPGWKPLAH